MTEEEIRKALEVIEGATYSPGQRAEDERDVRGRDDRSRGDKAKDFLKGGLMGGGSLSGGGFMRKRSGAGTDYGKTSELRDSYFEELSPRQRREIYFDKDGNVRPEALRAAESKYRDDLKELGYPDDKIDRHVERWSRNLQERAQEWINSPEGQTDIALEEWKDTAGRVGEAAATPEELFGFYERYMGDEDRYKALGDYSAAADADKLAGESRALINRENALQTMLGDRSIYDESIAMEGTTDADRAALELARRGASGAITQQNQAILRDMAARGMAGGGSEVMAKMLGQQQIAGAMSDQMLQNQIAARDRAMQAAANRDALMNMAQEGLGGVQQGYSQAAMDSYNRQAENATRRQAADEFNATNMLKRDETMAAGGVGTQNQAFNQQQGAYGAMSDYLNSLMGTRGTREARKFAAEQAKKDRNMQMVQTGIGAASNAASMGMG